MSNIKPTTEALSVGTTVTVSRGYRLGMWGPVENFTGTVEEFRKSRTPLAAVKADDAGDADVVVLFAWDTSGMFCERVYVVARLEDVTS